MNFLEFIYNLIPKEQAAVNNENSYHIGDLAHKYEASNRGSGFISKGASWGDPGGISYGSYQIETRKGTMAAYLAVNDAYTKQLVKLVVNSDSFMRKWRELSLNDPQGFQQSQFNFLCNKKGGYNDAITYAKKLGWADNFAMQSAIFSTSNQSGGWKLGIFNRAGITNSDSAIVQINKLYDARASYFKELSSLTNTIKKNIMQQRCGKNLDMSNYIGSNERTDCLGLL